MEPLQLDYGEKGKSLHYGFNDLNGDGIFDALIFRWQGKTAVFISESGKLPFNLPEGADWNAYFCSAFNIGATPPETWNPVRTKWGSYTLLVDRDGCGRFDSHGDFFYRVFDINGDGAPKAEFYHLYMDDEKIPYSNKIHFNLNGERDMSYLNFGKFIYDEEQYYHAGSKYIMNVHGSGFFLNSYSHETDKSWETPIAWYDFDFDGRTNMVMRCADFPNNQNLNCVYSGNLHEFELAFEVNGNTSLSRYHSLDFQLTFYSYGKSDFDYTYNTDTLDFIKPLPGSEFLSERLFSTRYQPIRRYLPYLDGCKRALKHKGWKGAFLIFDEDDDDNRWEEMFSNHEGEDPLNKNSPWHGYSDRIGDRTENDIDFGGGGKLYIGKFDGRLHLYHAEGMWWEIDYLGLYKGSCDRRWSFEEGPEPPKGMAYPRVRYYDTTGNGFIDKIVYETVDYRFERERQTVVREINLLDYADDVTPYPDVCELFELSCNVPDKGFKIESWDGLPLTASDFEDSPVNACYKSASEIYGKICDKMWADANMLYSAATRHGLNKSEFLDTDLKTEYSREELAQINVYEIPAGYSRHKCGQTRREKYNNGFWLREKVFEDICKYSGLDKFTLEKLYYTGKISDLCRFIDKAMLKKGAN